MNDSLSLYKLHYIIKVPAWISKSPSKVACGLRRNSNLPLLDLFLITLIYIDILRHNNTGTTVTRTGKLRTFSKTFLL